MRHLIGLLALCLIVAPASAETSATSHVKTIDRFIAAFNAQSGEAMAALVTDDVQWLAIDGDTVAVETNGKVALMSAMARYFQSCPTCRSKLAGTIASNDRVSAIEVASWQGKDGPRTQRGISVYEFSGGLIRRVYYFPSEK